MIKEINLKASIENISLSRVSKCDNAHNGYYELMKIQFTADDDAIENNLTTKFKPLCQLWKVA